MLLPSDPNVDNKSLFDTFSMFGNIVSVKVATGRDGASLGYGFVHFDSDEAANKAIDKVNNMMVGTTQVKVEAFKPQRDRASKTAAFTNVYVKNLPSTFTEAKLQELFGAHGTITNALLKMKEDPATGSQLGFGFVSYESHEQAQKAIDVIHGIEIDGLKVFASRAQKKSEREKELKEKFEKFREEKAKKYATGCNLYVKNLSEEVTEDMLRAEFSKFGAITSAKIMTDAVTQRSRGFGFICFTSAEEATKAVTETNKKMFCGMPLYVGLAMNKEMRRAHLEAQFAQARAKAMPMGPMGMMPQYMYSAQPMFGGPGPAGMRAAPGGFMGYPQMMMNPQAAGGAGGARGAAPQMGGPRGAPMGMYPTGPAGPRGPAGMPYMPMGAMGNVPRPQGNPRQPNAGGPRGGPAKLGAKASAGGDQAFLEQLAAATPDAGKTMLGEKLYPLIEQLQPAMAGKITGMLLEMDNAELLHYLETKAALADKVAEAMEVLRNAGEVA